MHSLHLIIKLNFQPLSSFIYSLSKAPPKATHTKQVKMDPVYRANSQVTSKTAIWAFRQN